MKVAADETTNSLIVTATPRDFVHVREVITALDRPKRQVFIEAAVLDISADSGLDVGVAWHGGNVHDAMIGPKDTEQTTFGGWRAGSSVMPFRCAPVSRPRLPRFSAPSPKGCWSMAAHTPSRSRQSSAAPTWASSTS